MNGLFEKMNKLIDESFIEVSSKLNRTQLSENDNKEKITWSEFIEKTGNDIDRLLIAHAKKEGLIYVGGKCRLTVTLSEKNKDNHILNVDAELYYKDQFKAEKNFQIYPLHTERPFESFADDKETKNQLEKLKTQQYEFNVETPQIKNEKE